MQTSIYVKHTLQIYCAAMDLATLGSTIKTQRQLLGLSQEQVSKLAGVSRVTVNQLENATITDLGVAKVFHLLDSLGIGVSASVPRVPKSALKIAAQTASTSYKDAISAEDLKRILQMGELPEKYVPHILTLLDETPLPIVLAAAREAASEGIPLKRIFSNLRKYAAEWQSNRTVWAQL